MTETERKALALVNEVTGWLTEDIEDFTANDLLSALIRAIEQHEAFRQEVSDAVEEWHGRWVGAGESHSYFMSLFSRFILPKPVDPLVEALWEAFPISFAEVPMCPGDFDKFRAALAARGLKIVEDKA